MPILAVSDVSASVHFYQKLGFKLGGQWSDDDGVPSFAIVVLDTISLGLAGSVDARGSGNAWVAYLYINDVQQFAAHARAQNVPLAREIKDQFYGCRDLEIVDPDGNRICFGQDLTPGDAGPGL